MPAKPTNLTLKGLIAINVLWLVSLDPPEKFWRTNDFNPKGLFQDQQILIVGHNAGGGGRNCCGEVNIIFNNIAAAPLAQRGRFNQPGLVSFLIHASLGCGLIFGISSARVSGITAAYSARISRVT